MMNASKATTAALSRAAPRRSLHATRVAAAGKDVHFGTEGRAMMLAGVDKLADAVQVKRPPKMSTSARVSFTLSHNKTHAVHTFYRSPGTAPVLERAIHS
jgi:hypothetical protein